MVFVFQLDYSVMSRQRLSSAICVLPLCLTAWATAAHADPDSPLIGGGQRTQVIPAQPADVAIEFVPSITDTVAASVDVSTRTSLTTLTVAPARPLSNISALWGLQAVAAYDSDKKKASFGAQYRLDPRWVLSPAQQKRAETLDRMDAIHARAQATRGLLDQARKEKSHEVRDLNGQQNLLCVISKDLAASEPFVRKLKALPAAPDPYGVWRSAGTGLKSALATYFPPPDHPCDATFEAPQQPRSADERAKQWAAALDSYEAYVKLLELQSAAYDGPSFCGGSGQVPCTSSSLEQENDRQQWKASLLTVRGLIPSLTVGYVVGVLPFDFDADSDVDQNVVGSSLFKSAVSWRVSAVFELDGTFSIGKVRSAPHDDVSTASVNEANNMPMVTSSGTAMVIVPHLLGTTYFDDYWYNNAGFQRGIGLGAVFSLEHCFEDARPQDCSPKGHTLDWFVGGAIDLRVAKAVRPRLRIGSRTVERFAKDSQGSIDASAFVAFAIE